VAGIDPGFSGALSFPYDDTVYDMPVMGEGAGKCVDGAAVWAMLQKHSPDIIVIEQVAARPGQGVSTMFRFGTAYGAVYALALASNAVVILVTPQKWKRTFGLIGKSKEASRALALRMFPAMRDRLKRKKDEGRAEGLLLSVYGSKQHVMH